jgi:Txe/YoeB family toxin of Txe-Axe toxin-antitoxin module
MAQTAEQEDDENNQLQYQFKIDRDLWDEWKLTVRRDKSLRQRITELVEEDLEASQ